MKIARFLTVAAIGFAAPISAQAATLNLSVTADNAFSVYLSTNDATLGTLVGSNLGGVDSQWQQSFPLSANLTNPIYFVHVIGTNYNNANGLFPADGTPNGTAPNPNAFLGQLSISGGGYAFANNSASLLTNSTPGEWRGIGAADNTSWTLPTVDVQSFGNNGGNNIWGNALGGPVPGISTSADWIWSLPDNTNYADLSTTITCLECAPLQPTPLPAALPLFVSAMAGMGGLLGWRRKRALKLATA